jgi:DNA sulfur modification protein DndE
MKNISGEAILFDMYYQGKDPVATFGNGDETPKIESKPVDAGTPQFKNIFVDRVVAKGAETGLLVRGLPEMPIHHINLSNLDIEAKQTYRVIEATDIQISNAKFKQTGDKKPELINVKRWKLN